MAGNQVEGGGFGVAREIAVVEAEQANHFERQAAHGHHAAKSDAAAQKSGLALAAEKVLQVLDNDVLRQIAAKVRQFGFGLPACQRLLDLLQGVLVIAVGGK